MESMQQFPYLPAHLIKMTQFQPCIHYEKPRERSSSELSVKQPSSTLRISTSLFSLITRPWLVLSLLEIDEREIIAMRGAFLPSPKPCFSNPATNVHHVYERCSLMHKYTHRHTQTHRQHSSYQKEFILKKMSYSKITISSVPPRLHAVSADVTVRGDYYTHSSHVSVIVHVLYCVLISWHACTWYFLDLRTACRLSAKPLRRKMHAGPSTLCMLAPFWARATSGSR